jgi:plastocyanin
MKIYSQLLMVSALMGALQAAMAADVTGTVTLSGAPPPETANELIKNDPVCGRLNPGTVTTHFYMVGPKQELADVVVTLKGVPGKSTGQSAEPVVLDQKNCLYTPTIMAIQTNQKLLVKNSDPTLHNVHVVPSPDSGNKEQNKAQVQGAPDITFTFPSPERFLKFKCDVHQWMFAWVTVVDNPYFAVTDKDGHFKISNVPPGKYTIEASHYRAAKAKPVSKEVEVKPDGAIVDFTLEVPAKTS